MRTKTRLVLWLGIVTMLVLAVVGLDTIWQLRSGRQDVWKANYNCMEYAPLA